MKTTSDLFHRMMDVVRGVAVGGLLHAYIDAEPAPASRPKVNTYTRGVYYTGSYARFYAECQRQLSAMKADVLDGRLFCGLEFVITRPKTSKLTLPRPDCDNLAKGPLDAITKAEKIWRDDSQISPLLVEKRFAEPGEKPGVNIHYGRLA